MENEYNLYCDDEFIGTYTTSQLAERFNVSKHMITEYGNEKRKYKKRYEWHKLYKAPQRRSKADQELMDEWDRVTEWFGKRKR